VGPKGGVVERGRESAAWSIVNVARDDGTGSLARRLTSTFDALGRDYASAGDGSANLDPGTFVLLRGSPNWYPRTWRQLADAGPGRATSVLWLSESLPMPAAAGLPAERLTVRELAKIALRDKRRTDPFSNARRLRSLAAHGLPDRVVVTSEAAAEFLAQEGMSAAVIPYGYAPSHGRRLRLERDLDVLFLGAWRMPRRQRALDRLRRAGIRVQVVGGWGHRGVWGEERTQLLNRSKLLLNLSRFPGQFSGERMLLGMANGALVVSEPIYRPAPFVPGTHYFDAPLDELPATIERLLADDAERERIADAGQAFVMDELTMERSVGRLLELVG
jgi:hypothetical protein